MVLNYYLILAHGIIEGGEIVHRRQSIGLAFTRGRCGAVPGRLYKVALLQYIHLKIIMQSVNNFLFIFHLFFQQLSILIQPALQSCSHPLPLSQIAAQLCAAAFLSHNQWRRCVCTAAQLAAQFLSYAPLSRPAVVVQLPLYPASSAAIVQPRPSLSASRAVVQLPLSISVSSTVIVYLRPSLPASSALLQLSLSIPASSAIIVQLRPSLPASSAVIPVYPGRQCSHRVAAHLYFFRPAAQSCSYPCLSLQAAHSCSYFLCPGQQRSHHVAAPLSSDIPLCPATSAGIGQVRPSFQASRAVVQLCYSFDRTQQCNQPCKYLTITTYVAN